jgi:hypothetical protein
MIHRRIIGKILQVSGYAFILSKIITYEIECIDKRPSFRLDVSYKWREYLA